MCIYECAMLLFEIKFITRQAAHINTHTQKKKAAGRKQMFSICHCSIEPQNSFKRIAVRQPNWFFFSARPIYPHTPPEKYTILPQTVLLRYDLNSNEHWTILCFRAICQKVKNFTVGQKLTTANEEKKKFFMNGGGGVFNAKWNCFLFLIYFLSFFLLLFFHAEY